MDRQRRKCDVLNRGLAGYTTRMANHILPDLVTSANAKDTAAMTIFFGANDAVIKGTDENPQQNVPLEEYTDNLKNIIDYLKSLGITAKKMILITPPPLDEASWGKQCILQGYKLDRRNSVTGEYAKACTQVGQEYGMDVLDLWTLMQEGGQNFTAYLSDGLHLSDEGNQFLESKLWPILEKKLSSLPHIPNT
ncbi:isoamyl acetate-hydrolyzing esterase 1 homolog isoform X2 [Hyperolius riggenbachi]|uniref:isoamyl acetate-hydrolyzing esterase 1 homolog isoform X2 n=1 Tax=Hyperolius riggenbachi TaxID=752182 RepID=UPI0035A2D417